MKLSGHRLLGMTPWNFALPMACNWLRLIRKKNSKKLALSWQEKKVYDFPIILGLTFNIGTADVSGKYTLSETI